MRRPAIMLSAMLLSLMLGLGGRWLFYVAASDRIDDAPAVGLTPFMPAPLRAWGCGRLRERFPGQSPPAGC
jgi:hypothetical protein